MLGLQLKDRLKETWNKIQFGFIKLQALSKIMNITNQNYATQFCYRTQLFLGLIAVICYIVIIPKHYNSDFANIHQAIKEDVEYAKREFKLERKYLDRWEAESDYDYETYEQYGRKNRIDQLTKDWDKYDWNKWYRIEKGLDKGYVKVAHLKTKARAIFGCVNSMLFMIAGVLGIISSKVDSRFQRVIALLASMVAVLFCLIFFLPVFNVVLLDYFQEMKEIQEYYRMIKTFQPELDFLPSYKKGYNMARVKINAEAVIALFIVQIVIGVLQAILAFGCSITLCISLCFVKEGPASVGESLRNRNMCIVSNSMASALTVDQALKLDPDLPPKYEEVLENTEEDPPPKFEDVKEAEEKTSITKI